MSQGREVNIHNNRRPTKTKSAKSSPRTKTVTAPRVAKKAAPARKATKPTAKPVAKTTAKRPRRKPEPSATELIHQSALKAAHYALEKKAEAIHVLDLTKITSMTDYFVIATGSSDRQVKAIAENVISEMRDTEGVKAWRSEGWDSLQWVIIDFVDFVVHVFQAEARKFYNIERLWADAPMEEVKDDAEPAKPVRKKRSTAKTVKSAPAKIKVISEFRQVG